MTNRAETPRMCGVVGWVDGYQEDRGPRWRHWGSLNLDSSHRQRNIIYQLYPKLVFFCWRVVRLPAANFLPSQGHQSQNGIDFLAFFYAFHDREPWPDVGWWCDTRYSGAGRWEGPRSVMTDILFAVFWSISFPVAESTTGSAQSFYFGDSVSSHSLHAPLP